MIEHQVESHQGAGPPQFSFRVVKGCRSSLERQVREAVRIQMRGTVLNKKGLYNRCKLTRLVVDEEWEEKVWKDAWAKRETPVNEEWLGVQSKNKRKDNAGGGGKRLKLEDKDGVAWGEETSQDYINKNNFLYSTQAENSSSRSRQGQLVIISGVEWFCRQLVKDMADTAVVWAGYNEGVDGWEEWEVASREEGSSKRSEKEERMLWKILDELDKEQAKDVERKAKRAAKKVSQARAKMGVDAKQPSITAAFNSKPRSEGIKTKKIGVALSVAQLNGVQTMKDDQTEGINTEKMSVARVQEVSVAQLNGVQVMKNDQTEVCRVCSMCSENMRCVQHRYVRADSAGSVVIGQSAEGKQESDWSRDKILQLQKGKHIGGGGTSSCPRTSNTSKNEEGGQCGKSNSNFIHNRNMFSRNANKFGGATGSGINSQEMDKGVCSVTPTKRKLLEKKNVKSLIATFEILPGDSLDIVISESPAKRRKLC